MRGDELKWISQKKSGLKRIDDVKWPRLKCAVLGVEELGKAGWAGAGGGLIL